MHIFLRGPIQVGKSTALQKAVLQLIKEYKLEPAGFLTHAGLAEDSDLYMSAYGEPLSYDMGHKIAVRKEKQIAGYPSVFESLGVAFLQAARKNSTLLIMDELGFLEKDALSFQQEVFHCLNGNIPVLGVIKERPVAWLEEIRKHPSVLVLDVTMENRSEIPSLICQVFRDNYSS